MLYVEYPAEYEFSLDFDTIKKNVKSVSSKIREYACKTIGTIPDSTVTIILNGVIIGTLMLSQLTTNTNIAEKKTTTEQVEIINQENTSTNTENIETTNEEINELKEETKTETEDTSKTEEKTQTVTNQTAQNVSTPPKTEVKKNTTTPSNTVNKPSSSNTSNNTNTSNNSNSTTSSIPSNTTVKVKLASGSIINLSLEDYVIGVIGAEMPAEFNTEALKAQAVAARTYALKKTSARCYHFCNHFRSSI